NATNSAPPAGLPEDGKRSPNRLGLGNSSLKRRSRSRRDLRSALGRNGTGGVTCPPAAALPRGSASIALVAEGDSSAPIITSPPRSPATFGTPSKGIRRDPAQETGLSVSAGTILWTACDAQSAWLIVSTTTGWPRRLSTLAMKFSGWRPG